MHLTEEQKTFIAKLDKTRHYKVEGRSYTHVTPDMMTPADINQLMEKSQGLVDITEGSIMHTGQMIL